MIRILIACALGMSSSSLVNRAKKYAKQEGIDLKINAVPTSAIGDLWQEYDVILLGPQAAYELQNIQTAVQKKLPIGIIPRQVYGLLKADKVIQQAQELLRK